MKRLTTGLFLALVLLVGGPLTPGTAAAIPPDAEVVYHVDFADPRRFSATLTSINNMMMHYSDNLMEADVRIVFVAHGIRFVTDSDLEDTPFEVDAELAEQRDDLKGRLQSLASVHGVKLELCDITRSQIGLEVDELFDEVTMVPSGVVRIAELQDEGFAYIKVE